MSILLDALRKSENSQKPVEPPTIHGNDHQLHEPESIKSSYVVVLIIIALVVIGWLLWQQYPAEVAGYSPPVELPAGNEARNTTATAAAEQPAQAEPAQEKPAQGKPTQAKSAQAKARALAASNAASGRPRTPVESYQPSDEEQADIEKERQETAAAVAKARRDAARDKPGNGPSDAASNQSAAVKARNVRLAKPVAPKVKNQAAAESKGSNAPTEKYQSPEPELISYWELPDSVRNGVPEVKFSVLVYSDDPANRFVLINGARLMQGDELKPGVVVEQIRRDGVVLSYQMYQFFVKR